MIMHKFLSKKQAMIFVAFLVIIGMLMVYWTINSQQKISKNVVTIRNMGPKIKSDIESILRGDTKLLTISSDGLRQTTDGKKFYSKDYEIERTPLAMNLFVVIYPSDAVIEEGVIGVPSEMVFRYVNKEKKEFESLSYGKREGEIFLSGYRQNPFIVKNIGDAKFKIYDFGAGRWGVDFRVYETFSESYLISFTYSISAIAGERPLKENEKNDEIIFDPVIQEYFKEIENIIANIHWRR